jgi:hypothetical protein
MLKSVKREMHVGVIRRPHAGDEVQSIGRPAWRGMGRRIGIVAPLAGQGRAVHADPVLWLAQHLDTAERRSTVKCRIQKVPFGAEPLPTM